MKKNILELCLSPDLGGLELFMLGCIEHFSKKTKLFIAIVPEKKLHNTLSGNNLFLLKRNKLFPFLPAMKLAHFIDKNNIDIIHFHWTKDIATVVLAKLLSKRKPKVIQSRHMRMTRFKDDVYHKWLYKHINLVHAVTHQVKEQLETFIPADIRPNIEVVHPGTTIPMVNKEEKECLIEKYALKDHFVVGMVGRIEEAKGQYILLDAVARLNTLDLKVLIVGQAMNNAYLQTLKEKTVQLGIEKKVIFTGFTTAVDTHIQLCNLTVLATEEETFGLVVIESMANGVPVIATNKGGPLEIITHGINGLLFDRTAEDLSNKIQMLYDDASLHLTISKHALESVKEKFNAHKQLNILYRIINES